MKRRTYLLALAVFCAACTDDDGGTSDASTGGDEVDTTAETDTTTDTTGSEADTSTDTTETTTSTDTTDTTDTTTDTTETTSTDTEDTEDTETSTTGDLLRIDCEVDAWDIDGAKIWKSAWMAKCLVPEIAPLMQEIDPVLYESFNCGHCHGEGLAGGSYLMPGAIELDWDEAATWDKDYFDGETFMGPMSAVVEKTAETLGYEPASMMNPDGFGCGGCHVGL